MASRNAVAWAEAAAAARAPNVPTGRRTGAAAVAGAPPEVEPALLPLPAPAALAEPATGGAWRPKPAAAWGDGSDDARGDGSSCSCGAAADERMDRTEAAADEAPDRAVARNLGAAAAA